MAVYKVPQDVEADDKLIGPFSFRQFIYLIIVALSGAAAWGLSRLFFPLVIIPLPVVLFFGILALPLRKDQPMEIYMAAMLSFFLKPHRRLWEADGVDSLIEITVPKTVEVQRFKDISRTEAEQRLGYLAELVDSKGWAVRGMSAQTPNSAMNSDVYFAAQQTEDILDASTSTSQQIDHRLEQSDAKRKQDMIDNMRRQIANPGMVAPVATIPAQPIINPYDTFNANPVLSTTAAAPVTPTPTPVQTPVSEPPTPTPVYNPYPTFQQSVIQPLGSVPASNPTPVVSSTSEKVISPDIMNLATNSDLSIETIAREANRIHEKEDMNEEVVISLR
jgi:hypothetical protein